MSKYRVTVDTGGTFSDFVFFNEDTGEITITKVPSTPKEPFQAVLNGVKELIDQGVPAADISFFCHGTTVGTNALLEEKGEAMKVVNNTRRIARAGLGSS